MNQELLAVVVDIGRMFMKSIPISLALAAVFTVLTQFWACNPGRPWWRKRELVTDLCYWFFIPVVTRYFRIGLLIAGAAVFFHITTADGLIAFYEDGHGPLAALPLVVQMLIFLVGEDVITYWTHRLFHGGRLWKYHAVHHSSEELEWISAARFHPINLFFGAVIADVVLLIAGISPNVFVVLGPLDSRAKCNRALREPDLHVFAKLFEDCLKRSLEAQAFSGREIGGDDDVLDFLVGHFVDVDLTRQPAS